MLHAHPSCSARMLHLTPAVQALLVSLLMWAKMSLYRCSICLAHSPRMALPWSAPIGGRSWPARGGALPVWSGMQPWGCGKPPGGQSWLASCPDSLQCRKKHRSCPILPCFILTTAEAKSQPNPGLPDSAVACQELALTGPIS
jgi:hypothetical protein